MSIGFRIQKDFVRPPRCLIEQYRTVSTPDITDAMNRSGAMIPEIKPIPMGVKMVGPALTVKTSVADNLMIHKAIQIAQPGDVLVVDAGGYVRNSVLGALMAATARKRGVEGIVIDGSVRDSASLRDMKYPVFARGVSPMNGQKNGPGEINFLIQCGSVSVLPGDIISGDDDGVVVIPRADAEAVIKEARRFAEKTEKRMPEIEAGIDLAPSYLKVLEEKGIV